MRVSLYTLPSSSAHFRSSRATRPSHHSPNHLPKHWKCSPYAPSSDPGPELQWSMHVRGPRTHMPYGVTGSCKGVRYLDALVVDRPACWTDPPRLERAYRAVVIFGEREKAADDCTYGDHHCSRGEGLRGSG